MNDPSGFLQKLKFASGEITSCDLNANYLLAVGSSDTKVRVLEWKTGLGFVEKFYSPISFHKYKITSVRFSPKGTMLASSSLDGTAILLDVLTGNKIFTMVQQNKSHIKFCEFTFDCTKIITAGDDGILCFWDILLQHQIRFCRLHEEVYNLRSLTLSPDSEYLLSVDSIDLLKLWFIGDVINKKPRCILLKREVQDDNYFCEFSPVKYVTGDSILKLKYNIVTCGGSNLIKVWDIVIERDMCKTESENFKCDLILINVLKEHVFGVISAKFDPTGNYVASTGMDNLVKLWEVNTRGCLRTFHGHTEFVTCAAFSKDSVLLVTGSAKNNLIIWDLSKNVTLDSQLITSCNVSCHFTHINLKNYCPLSVKANQRQKFEFILLQTLNFSSIINTVQFQSKDVLATAGGEKTVELWKREQGSLRYQKKQTLNKYKYSINHLDISPCGNKIVFCSIDRVIILWDLNMNLTYEMKIPGCNSGLRICKFSPDLKLIAAAGDDQEVYLWDANHLKFIRIVQRHMNTVTSLAFTHDSNFVVSTCLGGDIMFENLGKEKCKLRINNTHDLGVISCDFSSALISHKECTDIYSRPLTRKCSIIYLLATGGNDSLVKLWGIESSEIFVLKVFSGHGGSVNCVKFSASKPYILASCSSDTTVRIWHAKIKQCLHVLNYHKSSVTTCSFSNDMTLFATGSLDKTVLIFNLTERICQESEELIFSSISNKLPEKWTNWDIGNWFMEMGHSEAALKVNATELDGKALLTLKNDTIIESLGLKSEEEREAFKILCLKKKLRFTSDINDIEKSAPHSFLCPITHQIMEDPVICSDGFAYDRAALNEWFLGKKFFSPVTKENLKNTKVLTYTALKINIYKFLLEKKKSQDNC